MRNAMLVQYKIFNPNGHQTEGACGELNIVRPRRRGQCFAQAPTLQSGLPFCFPSQSQGEPTLKESIGPYGIRLQPLFSSPNVPDLELVVLCYFLLEERLL